MGSLSAAGRLSRVQTTRPTGHEPASTNGSTRRNPFPRRKVRRRQPHRTFKQSVGLFLIVLLVLGVAGSASVYLAFKSVDALQASVAGDFREGQAQLEAGKAALKTATKTGNTALIDEAVKDIATARQSFARAKTDVTHYFLYGPANAIPASRSYIAKRVDAVLRLSEMGAALCDAAGGAATVDRELITKPATGSTGGARLLTLLRQVEPQLTTVRADLEKASAAAAAVDPTALPAGQRPTLKSAITSIASGVASLDEFRSLLPVLYEVLGANGPRNYLLEQLNPAELRPGGGFFGTYSLLQVDAGNTKVLQSGQTFQLNYPRPLQGQAGYLVPPGPLHDFLGTYSWTIQDSNFFTSFPENAAAALGFSKIDFSVPIDGVIGMDFYTVVDLLTVTGPITVPGSATPIDANNFIPTLIALGDFGYAGGPAKQLVSDLGGKLMQAVLTLPPEKLASLLSVLNTDASKRHIQAFFVNAQVQSEMTHIGWSGAMNPTGAQDFMAEVEGNYGGTKANFYTTRSFQVDLTHVGGNLHHRVAVTLVNKTPLNIPNNYTCYARLLVPPQAGNLGVSGLSPSRFRDTTQPTGAQQAGGYVEDESVAPGRNGTVQFVFDYDTPWTVDAGGQHQIYWQKQPGTVTDGFTVNWHSGLANSTISGTLTQDVVIRLLPSSVVLDVGQAGSAHLPSLTL